MARLLVNLVFGVTTIALAPTTMPWEKAPVAKAAKRSARSSTHEAVLNKQQRLEFIRQAQVWMPTDVAAMDLRAGPGGPGAHEPDELVNCEFVETKLEGTSRKFACATSDGRTLKVRYGAENGEVEGSVLATRLLWALGFGADRAYPVRIVCLGCSADPFTQRKRVSGSQLFDPAVIEEKPLGHEMKTAQGTGWAWPELDLVDESAGGAPKAQRDALTLLAILMQHTDSKPIQQRLLCLPGGIGTDGLCTKPFLMVHDVGLTFGHGTFANRTAVSSVAFVEWQKTPVWREGKVCVGNLSKSHTGSLDEPGISEAGRALLAERLALLTDQQLHDLFEVARVSVRSRHPDGAEEARPASVDEWVQAFKQKRAEILMARCAN